MQILEPVSKSENSAKNHVRLIYNMQKKKFSNAYMSFNLHINNHKAFENKMMYQYNIIKYCEIFVVVQYFGKLKLK